MRSAARVARVVLSVVATALLGAVVALLGAFQHPSEWLVADVRLPVGVVAGIAALVLAQFVARDAVPLGLGPALVLISWTVVVVVLGSSTSEGDLAIPGGTAGEGFLYGGFLVGLVAAGWFGVRRGASGEPRSGR